jgi:hypothetical protein
VTLAGMELTGRPPALLEQGVLDVARSAGLTLLFGPRGNPGINAMGLVLRVQEVANRLLTRPVMVGRAWADSCADDWDGPVPECEWLGRQWPHRGHQASGHRPEVRRTCPADGAHRSSAHLSQ